MPRRKPGALLPLEVDILHAALSLQRAGEVQFHGFGLAQTTGEDAGARLVGHGTLYKVQSARAAGGDGPADFALGARSAAQPTTAKTVRTHRIRDKGCPRNTRRNQRTRRSPTPLAGNSMRPDRVSAVVLAVLAIPFIGMAVSSEVDLSVADFALAGTLLGIIGFCIEAAIRRRGNLSFAGAVACLGVAAAAIGELDDAPGLILLSVLMIAGGGAVAYRRVHATA